MSNLKAALPAYAERFFQPAPYKVCYGGRGGGRSWTFARMLLIMAAQRPLRILCARELQKSIDDSVHRLLQDQIELLGLPGFIILQREIRHVNGSLFLFTGLKHNVNQIKSMEGLDIVWVEEAEAVSKESWQKLIPTVRKEDSEIWVTFNPDKEEDETYQRFVVNPPERAIIYKASWQDNPWFTDKLREEKDYLYAVDPEAADWVWGGNIRKISEAQILRDKWTVEAFEVPYRTVGGQKRSLWEGPYFGSDFGSVDPTTLVKLWVAPGKLKYSNGILMVERESYKSKLDISDIPRRWREDVGPPPLSLIQADNARPETIRYLQQRGFPRIRAVKKWPGSIEDGIAYLRQFEQIVIHPRCKNVAMEARLYSYKVSKETGEVLPDIIDKHNHAIDAIRYALVNKIRHAKVKKKSSRLYSGISYRR